MRRKRRRTAGTRLFPGRKHTLALRNLCFTRRGCQDDHKAGNTAGFILFQLSPTPGPRFRFLIFTRIVRGACAAREPELNFSSSNADTDDDYNFIYLFQLRLVPTTTTTTRMTVLDDTTTTTFSFFTSLRVPTRCLTRGAR